MRFSHKNAIAKTADYCFGTMKQKVIADWTSAVAGVTNSTMIVLHQ